MYFCKQGRSLRRKDKPAEPLGSCETVAAEVSIKDAAKTLHDSSLLATISCIDLIANQCKYHNSCRNNYVKHAHRMLPPPVCVQPRRDAALNLLSHIYLANITHITESVMVGLGGGC